MVVPPLLRRPLRSIALAVGFVLAFARPGAAGASELGRTFVRTFTRADHQAHQQFWNPFQSEEGLMYFGNQLAVLEYDGRGWRVLKHPMPFTRAMAPAPNGDIFIGDEEQLGFLARPDTGPARFTSLLDRLPADTRPFGIVRDIRAWRGAMYFATDKNVLRWRDGAFRVWTFPGEHRHRLFLAGDRLILHRSGDALYESDGESFSRLTDAAELAQPGSCFAVADGADHLLVGLGEQGLFRVARDGMVAPWRSDADAILRRTSIYTALRLRDGEVAIGTTTEGVVILSPDGKLLRHLTPANGLPHATAFSLGEDRDGALWVSTANAPARVLWRSPATVFLPESGGFGEARMNDLVRHRGTLYYLATDGLYRLVPAAHAGEPARFERDPRVPLQAAFISLLSHPGGLLIAGANGLQRLGAGGLETLAAPPDGALELAASKSQPQRVFFTHTGGIGTGRFDDDGTWHDEGSIPGLDAEGNEAVEDASGVLWVGTFSRGVFKVSRPAGAAGWRAAQVDRLTTAHGLPADHGAIYVQESSVGILFDTAQGIYRFDAGTARFVPFRELTAFESRPIVLNPIEAGARGEIWTNGILFTKEIPYPLLRLRARGTGAFETAVPPLEVQDFFAPLAPHRIYFEPTATGPGIVWAKSETGLLRIDLARYSPPAAPPRPLIRRVAAEGMERTFPRSGPAELRLKFSRQPMTIAFASGQFRAPELERFQTRLVGFNEEWTEPAARNDIGYTNLEGGPFRFEVRTVDRQGRPGRVSGFSFRVAPPWHRSRWAYGGYALLALGALSGFVRWRLARGERERQRLEALVARRTAELDAANKAKSLFLANMSHELRTPLNGVIGYAQVLQKSPRVSGEDRERLRVIQSAGDHLLEMINEVLDFSRIEAGKLELQSAPFHLPQLLRDVAANLEPRADAKGLTFAWNVDPALPERVVGDAQKLRQVLDNLLSNAVKFTPEGRVELRVSRSDGGNVPSPATVRREGTPLPTMFHFAVSDTGVGISESDREKLFQPFQQAADGRPPEPGTGLGLAICQRIVQLMGGTLAVDSRRGAGTTFTFSVRLDPVAADPSPSADDLPVTGYVGERRRVLVVDDIAVNRAVLVDLLKPLGFDVREAANGSQALSLAAEFRPDIVFLDLRMPGMSGFEVAAKLRDASTPGPAALRPKLIAMSASVLSFNRDDAFAAGCEDFLTKPFHERDLLDRLARHLDLTWIRAAGTSADPIPIATEPPLDAATLDRLLSSARRGEVTRLREQLAALHGTHPRFAAEAESLLKAFRMEALRALLGDRSRAAR